MRPLSLSSLPAFARGSAPGETGGGPGDVHIAGARRAAAVDSERAFGPDFRRGRPARRHHQGAIRAPAGLIVLGVCAGLTVLDIVFAVYCLRNIGSTLVITADDITFTKRQREGNGPPSQQVIQRVGGSTLSFRMAANGMRGSEYTGYVLKLRDSATGKEVYAGAFGRRKVQQACESQGWSFS
jgi:hypothetical protein